MALSVANQYRMRQADAWLYRHSVPYARKFDAYMNRSFDEALGLGIGRGLKHFGTATAEASGAKYLHGAFRHYSEAARGSFRFPTASSSPHWDRYFESVHPSLRVSRPRMIASALGRRGASAANVLLHGLAPATILYYAGQDEMGFGVGLAKETAAWGAFLAGGSIGMQMGGWAAARATASVGGGVGWALGKIPGVRKTAAVAIGKTIGKAAGAALGGPVGWVLGAMTFMEVSKWGVGFALHTLPTFAKQFRADMETTGYGGGYVDSMGAVTMRQRSLQAIGRSHTNARSALGQEASLMHV